jgi:hypothetical protein
MKNFRLIVALMLLLAAAVSPSMAGASMRNPAASPGGCHEHGKKVPAPQQTDYACCVAGHGVAVVQASDVRQTPLQASLNMVPTAAPQGVAAELNQQLSLVSSASPPTLSSLRI